MGSLNFAKVVMLDLACATGRAVRLSGPILTEVGGPFPFSRTLLRGPLVHSDFGLNSITCTIIEIKT